VNIAVGSDLGADMVDFSLLPVEFVRQLSNFLLVVAKSGFISGE
jgi:hypothetical protein